MNQKQALSFNQYIIPSTGTIIPGIIPSTVTVNPVMFHSTAENYATLEKYQDSRIIIDSKNTEE